MPSNGPERKQYLGNLEAGRVRLFRVLKKGKKPEGKAPGEINCPVVWRRWEEERKAGDRPIRSFTGLRVASREKERYFSTNKKKRDDRAKSGFGRAKRTQRKDGWNWGRAS